MTDFVEVVEGSSPLILSMPHGGRDLTPEVDERLTEAGKSLIDTDWWIERLYDFHADLGAGVVRARLSRYVIDLNRDPSGASLYPDQNSNALCPIDTFDGVPIYLPGDEPDEAEIERRIATYFEPYHEALGALIRRKVERHGYALLYDCHSIRSVVPRLFKGQLAVFNIGTFNDLACDPQLGRIVAEACAKAPELETVVNGRFSGGWITRSYGDPAGGVHALQMELAQRAYMTEAPPWSYLETPARAVQKVLRQALAGMLTWAPSNRGYAT